MASRDEHQRLPADPVVSPADTPDAATNVAESQRPNNGAGGSLAASPADTIRRLRFSRVPCPEPGCTGTYTAVKVHADNRGVTAPCPGCRGRGSVPDPAFDAALDAALLAVGERDKAEIERLKEALVAQESNWLVAYADHRSRAGERDKQQIARLTEAIRACICDAKGEDAVRRGKMLTLTKGQVQLLAAAGVSLTRLPDPPKRARCEQCRAAGEGDT